MIYSGWINDNLTDFYIKGGFKMRKMYRLIIAIIALFGAVVMRRQQDYFAMTLMILLATVFVSRAISSGIPKV